MMVLHIYVFSTRAHGGRVGEVHRATVVLEEGTLDRWSGASNVEPFFLHLLDEEHEWLDLSGGLLLEIRLQALTVVTLVYSLIPKSPNDSFGVNLLQWCENRSRRIL